ncbi:MAG: sugar phosphate nucleotidyltransferase [Sphingomonadales bacterium]|jgi:D-glycero-alpha-D-manno-heptose 1-phosphate guanylyltransferase
MNPAETPLFLLAGGFGTRLSSVVKDVPKPLAPIHGRPFLSYLLENYHRQGIRRFVFLVHHKADLMKAFVEAEIQQGVLNGCDVKLIAEQQPMGTGGAVKAALKELPGVEHFLVANADTWLSAGIAELLNTDSPAIAAVWQENTARYGSLKTEGSYITRFIEKSPNGGAGWINAGLYSLHAGLFIEMPDGPFSIENTLFPTLLKQKTLKFAAIDGDFIDIGIPEDYEKCKEYLKP